MHVLQILKKGTGYPLLLMIFLSSFFSISAETVSYKKEFNKTQFHQALLAEFYNQNHQPKLTLNHYLPIALKSSDPALVKRVTEIATGSAQLQKGLIVAKHWVELSPESLEAQQYLSLLLLRNGLLEQSAQRLQVIRQLVDKLENTRDVNDSQTDSKKRVNFTRKVNELETGITQNKRQPLVSKGLKFIGALLVAESHHDKAYAVYRHYIAQIAPIVPIVPTTPVNKNKDTAAVPFKDQKQLILASLAMQAKDYKAVVSAFDNMELKMSDFFASAAVMKAKALKKLGKNNESVKLLLQVAKSEKTSDSLRLELTRQLISVGEKDAAVTMLGALLEKHPDNNDLLKALVALNINQKHWREAKRNNKKLANSKAYQNESNYFYGEIYEGQGELKRALTFYENVQKGTFLKYSHRKRAKVLAQLEGIKASQEWLQGEGGKSSKKKDKTYWLKLEEDLLSDEDLVR